MYDKLTQKDIDRMQEEIEYRKLAHINLIDYSQSLTLRTCPLR